jgi:hypothetical protein
MISFEESKLYQVKKQIIGLKLRLKKLEIHI